MLKGERFFGAVRTQTSNSKELTKMVMNRDVKCYQTFCRSKSKGVNELISKNFQKNRNAKTNISKEQWTDYLY